MCLTSFQVWELCSSVFGENSTKDVATLVHATPSLIQVHFNVHIIYAYMEQFRFGSMKSSIYTNYILYKNFHFVRLVSVCSQNVNLTPKVEQFKLIRYISFIVH
jgi:hypothetical protein